MAQTALIIWEVVDNPIECLEKMEGRIITFHLKDVAEWGKPAARDVPLGTGKADYAAVLEKLHRQGFRGVMPIEYEHDSPPTTAAPSPCSWPRPVDRPFGLLQATVYCCFNALVDVTDARRLVRRCSEKRVLSSDASQYL